jgi:methionine--tRNA ligase beta chain
VVTCEKVEKSSKLLKFTLSLGKDGERTVVSGIQKWYAPEALVGKQVAVITNLKTAKLAGIESQGMILSAMDENGNLRTMLDQALSENQTLADDLKKAQARAAKHDTTRVTDQVPGEGNGAYQDVPDTILLTVYYPISSTQLSAYEQAHLASHMKLLRALDPGRKHRYIVIGSADAGTGSRETNERLASKRADSIKRVLVDQGVAEDMIDIQTQIVESGDPRLMRASHVIIYPLLKK